MNDMRDYEDLLRKVLKIIKRCSRDLNEELRKENPPMDVALTAKQTCISLLVLDMVHDCMRAKRGDFDEISEMVLNIIGKALKHLKLETELKEGTHDSNQTTH